MKKVIFRTIISVITLFMFNVFFTSYLYSAATQNKFIDYTLKTIDGKNIVLSDLLKEKNVVLVFWATWCPACRAEIPHIETFYKKNKDEVAVIGINIGESRAKVTSFVERKKILYPIALDSDTNIARAYKVVGVPTIVAINKDGTIVYFGHLIHEAEEKIKEGRAMMGQITFDEIYEATLVRDGVKEISYVQFMKIRNSGEGYVLLDVLSQGSYNNGHIEGAKSFPVDKMSKENAEKMLPKDSNIVIYCASFSCHASTNAARILSNLGYKVLDYKGGLKEWQEKGNQLVK